MMTLPIDAVPDITNNQVQIVTVSPTLAPQEVEQLITFPIEIAMSNIMNVEEIRSVSRFGLSLVTVVFKESVPTLQARQLIGEQIQAVAGEIPPELGTPELMPVTTGLGEIYQYTLEVAPGYEDKYDAMELRTIQDWIVKRQLSGIPGIVEINSFGGYLKQYEVAVDPDALYSLNITIGEVFEALNRNNQNTGGSYIEKVNRAYYIRSEGMIDSLEDIERIVVTNRNGIPVHVCDVAKVRYGSAKRFGAMTIDGKGECVGGIAMMLKGANANVVTTELEKRVAQVQKMLPEGIRIEPYLNRSELVDRNISTVIRNLIEGAIIVFLVLIIFLGNVRAGLIVASVIPLAMLFAFILMRVFGVSANLMSLGAIDFGIVVDGSIVILEGILAHIYSRQFRGRTLTKEEMNAEVEKGAARVVRSATFAVLIILIVFFPILTLTGIEGKYFTPMAKTLVFCIIGALILSLTYVPMRASFFLKREIKEKKVFADRFFEKLGHVYKKALTGCLHHIRLTVSVAFLALAASLWLFTRLGAEFIPTLDEGDFAMQMTLPAGSSLTESIEVSRLAEKTLKEQFPEIKHVVAKIGTAEVPTDPMAVEDADVMIVMKPFEVATIDLVNGPLQINRDATKRRIVIGVNVRDADIQQVVNDIQQTLEQHIQLKPGYYFSYGGQFENLQNAIDTLLIVIPVALMLILLLLFFAFKSVTYTLVVFSTVPLSLIGGILALWLRGLPFSISAGVGFIALFGVAVLNGILMINHFNEVRKSREYPMCTSRIIRISCPHLLRPVFLTGLVASLGFVPMAIATSAGAEVQRPLATVVIGGLIVSTVLTLLIIPVFYHIVNSTVMLRTGKLKKWFGLGLLACLAAGIPSGVHAQEAPQSISLNQALEMAVQHSPRLQMADTDLARIRATRGEVFEATPTEFSYSWGQLNGVQRKDKELAVTQSVGSLLTPFYKNALVNKQVQTGNLYKQLVEKEVKAEVKRAWAYYLYAWNLKDMYKQQSTLADKMQKAGEVRYKQGDISLLEKSMITTVASDMRHKLYQADEELKLAASRLQWICYADFPIAPDDNSIQLYPVSIDTVSLSEIHLDYLQSQVHEKRALLNIERSRFFPELSVGYVRQNILPDKGLNSWMIGVSFPIWFLPQRSKIRQARFEMNKAQTQAEAQTRELNLKVSELRASIRRYAESIRFYTTSALTEADNLMKTADAQFRESESDITQYVQSLNAALEIKKGYIEAVYQYNLAALEYELYHQ